MSLMLIFHSAGPLLSPIIGAVLTVQYGWEAMFVFLSVYSLAVAVFFAFAFRETIAEIVPDALRPGPMLRNFAEIARSRVFWAYTACATASYGVLQPFPHIAGAASSLVGFVQQIIGALTGVVLAALSDGSQLALAGGVLFWAVFGLSIYWYAIRKYRAG